MRHTFQKLGNKGFEFTWSRVLRPLSVPVILNSLTTPSGESAGNYTPPNESITVEQLYLKFDIFAHLNLHFAEISKLKMVKYPVSIVLWGSNTNLTHYYAARHMLINPFSQSADVLT